MNEPLNNSKGLTAEELHEAEAAMSETPGGAPASLRIRPSSRPGVSSPTGPQGGQPGPGTAAQARPAELVGNAMPAPATLRPAGSFLETKIGQRPKCHVNVRRILERLKSELVSAKELEGLRALDAEWQRLTRCMFEHGWGSAHRVVVAASENVRRSPTAENIAQLKAVNSSSHDLDQQYQHVVSTLKRALRDFDLTNVQPALAPVFVRAAKVLERQSELSEAAECSFAELAGVPFEPSETLRAVQFAASSLRARAGSPPPVIIPSSPRHQLSDVFDLV